MWTQRRQRAHAVILPATLRAMTRTTPAQDSLIPGFASGLPAPALGVTGKVVFDRAALKRARAGTPWLSPADVVSYEGDNGPFADVTDDSGLPVGTVLWDPTSEIRARLVSTTRTRDPLGLLATRLERAEHRRKSDLKDAGAFRLCHGDADGIPGVFIDRFGDALHVDVDSPVLLPWLEALLASTMERQGIITVVLRHAGRVERLRGTTSTAHYREGQLDLEVDLGRDDVRRLSAELDAMKRLRAWARGRTLDVFANGGGFGLQLAQAGASSSTIVDLGTDHAERVQTFARNNGLADRVEVISADPLYWLKQAQRSFDLVVCHPPYEALAPQKAEQQAVEIAATALRLVGEGAIFCARAASASLDDERFAAALADAGTQLRRRLQVLARLGPGPDHPTLAGTPMSPSILVLRVLSTG
jgi:23S rRNA (cytosine1962-C5)-methyltransferase